MYLVDRNITNSQMRKKFSIEFSRKQLDLNMKNLLISLLWLLSNELESEVMLIPYLSYHLSYM